MKEIYFEFTGKTKITLAKDEIRIKLAYSTSVEDKDKMILIARQLEEEYKDFEFTIRTNINFSTDCFRLMWIGKLGAKNQLKKFFKDYIKS